MALTMSQLISKRHRRILEIEEEAVKLIDLHLTDTGWKLNWNNAISSLGICDYRNKTIWLSKRWSLSVNPEEVTDTILHEIAHAITPGDGHGKE